MYDKGQVMRLQERFNPYNHVCIYQAEEEALAAKGEVHTHKSHRHIHTFTYTYKYTHICMTRVMRLQQRFNPYNHVCIYQTEEEALAAKGEVMRLQERLKEALRAGNEWESRLRERTAELEQQVCTMLCCIPMLVNVC